MPERRSQASRQSVRHSPSHLNALLPPPIRPPQSGHTQLRMSEIMSSVGNIACGIYYPPRGIRLASVELQMSSRLCGRIICLVSCGRSAISAATCVMQSKDQSEIAARRSSKSLTLMEEIRSWAGWSREISRGISTLVDDWRQTVQIEAEVQGRSKSPRSSVCRRNA